MSLIVVIGVLLVLAIVGFNWIDTEFNQLMIYRDYTRVQKNFEEVMEVNDGAVSVYAFVETEGDPLSPEVADEVLKLEKELVEGENAAKAVCAYDFYARTYAAAMNKDKPEYPPSMTRVNFLASQISSLPSNPVKNLLDREENAARVTLSQGPGQRNPEGD
ncbi:MAG: hypothetical protein ACOC88_03945 [Candidatus Bipolaricaulota bacterium]